MSGQTQNTNRWIVSAALAAIILFLAVPLLLGAGYTYPAADDFITFNGSLELARTMGPVLGPLRAAWNFYMGWEGRYTSNLFLFVLMPYVRFGLNGFRVCMVLLSLFFLGSLFFMAHAAVEFSASPEDAGGRHGRQNRKLFLGAVLLFASLGLPETYNGRELFFWYTASAGYLVGICCLFLSVGCLLLANCREKRRGYEICSALFGFLAAGCSPQVASFVCSWLLLALLTIWFSQKPEGRKGSGRRLHLGDILPFLVSFCGALANVFAPGSMTRSRLTMGDVPYGIADAVRDTFGYQKEEMHRIFYDPLFITLAVVVFLACLFFEVRVARPGRFRTPIGVLLMTGAVLVSNFLCIFPVVMGYHGGGLSNCRTQYVADFEFRFSLLFALIYIAQYVRGLLPRRQKRGGFLWPVAGVLGGFLLCVCSFLFWNDRRGELLTGYSFALIRELSDGTVQEIFAMRKEVLEALEAAEDGTDVSLQMPAVPESVATYPQGILPDPESQVNRSVAGMFGLHSMSVEYGAE